MDKKKVIKFMINVLPIVLVPLFVERKRIKQHPDVQKVTNATSKVASKTSTVISNTASDFKEYVGDKKQDFENKRELKKFAREHDPAYIEKKGEKLAKQNRKDADKMNKILQKNIEKRHKEEQKQQQEAEKARIKSFKKYKDYVARSPKTQNKSNDTEA
ncbi:hypothetical protein J2P86_03845 [Staphylococcus sp. 30400_3112M30941]|nr:hypothetical protein [Staphylococcus sp. 30403_3112M30944]MBO0945534.1 hypothetical protein [Staphylococcus sp. 30402_3112M30943]MBO0963716.1 hypothetical protein [Staphylococcus sp. 30400_3112M30941]MBO0967595.1 hypothetical protein [Staphylococcus sp. 30401_3112M30942]